MCSVKTIVKQDEVQRKEVLHPVHLTALAYLCEAVNEERYEECSELVQTAKEIGVREDLIHKLLHSTVGYLYGVI